MKIKLKDGVFYEITDLQINSWKAIYSIDVIPCLVEIEKNMENNPHERLTAKKLLKHINGCLENEKHKQINKK